jgi:type 1 glutamine amidotransferase
LLRLFIALWSLAAVAATNASGPIRVMVVTGGHPYDTSFESLFEGYPDISAMVYPRDVAFARDLRTRWDVLVLYDLTSDITETEKANLRAFAESGKGILVLHHAIADYNHWQWWWQDLVGGRFLLKPEGELPGSTYHQNQEVSIEAAADHPITAGLGNVKFTDEVYKLMWISPKARPILKTNNPLSDPVLGWISPYDKSRVVAIQCGHDRQTHTNATYHRLIRNAILWAATRQE